MEMEKIVLQCVYGDEDIPFIERVMLPLLPLATNKIVEFYCLNYESEKKINPCNAITIKNIPRTEGQNKGFGFNHNLLYKIHNNDLFIIVNPDCIPTRSSIDHLLNFKKLHPNAAILESCQWPFEHPKEFDKTTLRTPWASGFFCLIDGNFFRKVCGFDENIFLYCEDVDLSWRAWLNDYEVVYIRNSKVIHFSGGRFFRKYTPTREMESSAVGFLILSYKFFGEEGVEKALNLYKTSYSPKDQERFVRSFNTIKDKLETKYQNVPHPMVKILGLNKFA